MIFICQNMPFFVKFKNSEFIILVNKKDTDLKLIIKNIMVMSKATVEKPTVRPPPTPGGDGWFLEIKNAKTWNNHPPFEANGTMAVNVNGHTADQDTKISVTIVGTDCWIFTKRNVAYLVMQN